MSDTLREHLEAIRGDFGRLTPEVVVDVARDPNHPLHDRFEWDDTEAAERYRRVQARELIRRVRVVSKPPSQYTEGQSVRYYHSVHTGEGTRAYTPIDEIVDNPMTTALLLQEMERDWMALYRRFGAMQEFLDMVAGTLGDHAA